MKIIKIGSRESRLAVVQSESVISALHAAGYETELVTMKTTGDKILDKTLDKIGGKGLFVKELDAALRDGRVDFTVHSLKDMPMDTPDDLPLVAVSPRADVRDVLVLPEGVINVYGIDTAVISIRHIGTETKDIVIDKFTVINPEKLDYELLDEFITVKV
ncbi:MAG: hypothetical protein EOM63_01400, partial [Clostridia bacterium]|nr:hypothetical protein [Clostridia bacterium]